MKMQKWGRIINISALSGKEPGEELIASNVVKSGLISFSKTMSRELASDNIIVNCVSPGLINSPQNDSYFSRVEKDEALSRIPLHRFGDPKELADAVVFLCSERASYITGVNLLVDGGASHSV
jgi:NAD(P)-dependent dehydrogenase (short-subunit alcohol dehydrogenase family)